MTIPTGNLYKFMAILGVLFFVSCVLFPCVILELNNRETIQMRRNTVRLTQEREALVSKIKNYENIEINSADSLTALDVSAAQMEDKIEQYKDGIDLRTKQILLESDLLDEQLVRQKTIELVIEAFFIFSAFLIFVGLIGWYFKLQRPLNILIKYEMRK